MSDLISREALLGGLKNTYVPVSVKLIDIITNAPAIEQGEPVLTVGEYMPLKMADILRAIPHGTKLYTAPPQPQTVKDALEKAARICDEIEDKCNKFDRPGCGDAIRALIED